MNIEQEIESIKQRNKKVELDKAWERSLVRRLVIVVLTYIVAVLWLYVIHESSIFVKAVVPVAGYILSTLSLSTIKNWWEAHHIIK